MLSKFAKFTIFDLIECGADPADHFSASAGASRSGFPDLDAAITRRGSSSGFPDLTRRGVKND